MSNSGYAQQAMQKSASTMSMKDQVREHIKRMFPSLDSQKVEELLESYAENGLSLKEQERVDALEAEHRKQIKRKKIEQFKALPKPIREEIITKIEVEAMCHEISTLQVKPCEELEYLRSIDMRYAMKDSEAMRLSSNHIAGVSNEELVEAHAETLLLSDDTESK